MHLGINSPRIGRRLSFIDTGGSSIGVTATAAFSLRKINSSATKAIRVRRDSDNAELDIGFVGNNLDTGALSVFCAGANGLVVKWYGQEDAFLNDATQLTAASQPKIYDSVTGIILTNGKPSVQFDGVDDYLPFDSSGITGGSFSIFSTLQRNISATDTYFLGGTDGGIRLNLHLGWRDADTATIAFFGDDYSIFGVPSATTQTLFTAFLNDSTLSRTLYIDSVSYGGDTAGGTLISNNGSALGRLSANYGDINMQEMIMYGSDKSTERTAIETDINSYYGVY